MPGSAPPVPPRRISRPIWLNQPGRLSAMTPSVAIGTLALLLVLIAGLLWTGGDADPVADRLTPVSAAILDHVRHGQDFYSAAIDALRENGRPLRPVLLAVPLPALPVTLALMPPLVGQLLLVLLGLAVIAGWARRCWPLFEGRGPRALIIVLLVAGLYPALDRAMVSVPEVWAALLIALSLVQRRPDAMPTAIALGLAAMILSPVALLHALLMAFLAWRAGAEREATGWIAATAIAMILYAAHAHRLNAMVGPIDPAIAFPFALQSPGAWLAAIASASVVGVLPMVIALPLAVLAALGWAHWRQPVARRAGITLAAYALLGLLTGAPAFALAVAPLIFLGVVFAPDAVRELIAAARDRRRITVTRVVR
ncbi:hypothetical protein [uncultured Sphingomonas sp.]|uniref:hypothetical protein n=1 Tax=uncultured Sphingomonas sp. TaxID=158754 RepID=UPI0025D93E5D|nr:hypothetical protein [uncultured Sphingomonas sp.]